MGEFNQMFRNKITLILQKLFQKIVSEKGKRPNSFCEGTIILTPKLDKDVTKRL